MRIATSILTSQRLQLPQGHGDIEAGVRHSHSAGAGLPRLAVLGRALGDDLLVVLHEGRLAGLPRNATMGQFAIITYLDTELHGGWSRGGGRPGLTVLYDISYGMMLNYFILACRRTGTTVEHCAESSETWAARRRPTKNSTPTLPCGNTIYKWVKRPTMSRECLLR